VPVVDNGELVGIVTSRDMRFETKLDDPVSYIMTKKDKLVTVGEGASDEEVLRLMHKHRIEKVLVADEGFRLKGLITVKDIQKARDNPTPPRIPPSACSPAPRSAWAATPRRASRRWSPPAST
jgi:IMP dehydrogenase